MSKVFSHRSSGSRSNTALLLVVIAALGIPELSSAQGFGEKMAKAARGFASMTTEAGMLSATSLDLETKGLSTVSVGALVVGVSQVDFKEAVGVRVHIYAMNPTDQPVSIPMPTEGTFILVDGKGRRLQFLSVHVKDAAKGASMLIVPALERVAITALYSLSANAGSEAILKIGTAGIIRGIPLGDQPTVAPAEAMSSSSSQAPASPPRDTTVVRDSVSRSARTGLQ